MSESKMNVRRAIATHMLTALIANKVGLVDIRYEQLRMARIAYDLADALIEIGAEGEAEED